MNFYNNEKTTKAYLAFLNSENGLIQQRVLSKAVLKNLPQNPEAKILDAACGSGWLTETIFQSHKNTQGIDISESLINYASKSYHGINFSIADLQKPIQLPSNYFDCVILNMASTDLDNLKAAYNNLFGITKPGGELLVTIPNPKYAFPVGIWKRSWLDILLGKKPKLIVRQAPTNKKTPLTSWSHEITTSYYYTLEEQLQAVSASGFKLNKIEELRSEIDSPNFNLQYILYRYPTLLLLKFVKPGE